MVFMSHNAAYSQPVNMVLGQLLTNGIHDTALIEALANTPREYFISPEMNGAAYADEDIPLANGRVLLQPLSVAKMLKAAEFKTEYRVLVIGCCTGYVAALVSKFVKKVISVDSDTAFLGQAKNNLTQLHIHNVELISVENMAAGYALSAPYDVIMVAGGVQTISDALLSQLSVGGKLLAIRQIAARLGAKGLGKLTLYSRVNDNTQQHEIADMTASLLPNFELTEKFVL